MSYLPDRTKLQIRLENQTDLVTHPGWRELVAETHEQMRELAQSVMHISPLTMHDPDTQQWLMWAMVRYQTLENIVGPVSPSEYDMARSLPETIIERLSAELNSSSTISKEESHGTGSGPR